MIEFATKNTITTLPFLRAKQLDSAADLSAGLDAVLRALPKDSDDIGSRDALRRAYVVQPHAKDSALMWDIKLGSQIEVARVQLGL